MPTKKNIIYNKHHEWIKQMDDAYVGNTLICPYCGEKAATITFCFFPNDVGYCYAECENCKAFEPVISRMEKNDQIKANIKMVNA